MVSAVNSACPEPDSVTGGQGPPPPGVAEEWNEVLGALPADWNEVISKLPADVTEELRKLSAGAEGLLRDALRDLESQSQGRRDQLRQTLPAVAEGPSGLRVYNPEQ